MSKIQSLLEQRKLRNKSTGKAGKPDLIAQSSSGGPGDFDLSAQQLLSAVWRNKSVLIVAIGASLVAGVLFILLSTPLYEAESLILIEPHKAQAGELQAAVGGIGVDAETIKSETYIISSVELSARIVDELDIESDPEFAAQPGLLGRIFGAGPEPAGAVESPALGLDGLPAPNNLQSNALIQRFRDLIQVGVLKDSRVIAIRFRSEDPRKAQLIVNTVADEYLALREKLKLDFSSRYTTWLDKQVADLMDKVKAGEAQIEALRQEYGIVEGARGELSAQELGQISTQLIMARAERASIGAQLDQARQLQESPNGAQSASEVLNSPMIQRLRGQEIDLQRQLAELSSELGEMHPRMQQMRAEISDLQSKIDLEIANIVAGLENQYDIAVAKERSVEADLNRLKANVAATNQKEIEIRSLEREVEADRAMLGDLLRTQNEASPPGEGRFLESDARIISHALPPRSPVFPNKKLIVGLALFSGLVLGGVLILFLETTNASVRSVDELDSVSGKKALGFVPRARADFDQEGAELQYAQAHPNSSLTESVRTIIWNLKLMCRGDMPQVLAVASSTSNEGKSTIANLFCLNILNAGSTAIVVDADMRRPSLHEKTGVELSPGLTDYLSGSAELGDVVKPSEVAPNFHVVPAGTAVDGVSDLLGSPKMLEFIDELRALFDVIILDTPPVVAAVDAQLASRVADATVLVVRWKHTPRKLIKETLSSLAMTDTPVVGTILSMVDMKKYSYYGYGISTDYAGTMAKYYGES